MKSILSILIAIAVIFSGKGDFKLVKATQQGYAGGRAASGYGTNYEITIVAQTSSNKLKFNSLWIGKERLEISLQLQKGQVRDGAETFKKGDTLYIMARKHIRTDNRGNPLPEEEKKDKVKAPKYKGAGLIEFSVNGKNKRKEIAKFKELEFEARP